VGTLFIASCENSRVDETSTIPESSSKSADISNKASTYPVLVVGDKRILTDWLANSHGNVVLVDFWATWCGPCAEQFPNTIELAKQHKEAGLKVFSVSMDEPEDEPAVSDFLKRKHAQFETLLSRYGIGAEFAKAFEIRGDLPFYRLYDRNGHLRYSFSADPEGIEKCEAIEKIDERVKELLAEAQ
jgi:thiol-disulfide isomerase/thioredoxin